MSNHIILCTHKLMAYIIFWLCISQSIYMLYMHVITFTIPCDCFLWCNIVHSDLINRIPNRYMTFEKAGSRWDGSLRFVFLWDVNNFGLFYLMSSLPSVNDWLISRKKGCLVVNGVFLIIEWQTVSSSGAVSFKLCGTFSTSERVPTLLINVHRFVSCCCNGANTFWYHICYYVVIAFW